MKISTTGEIQGYKIKSNYGIVFGNCARTRGVIGRIHAEVEKLIGGSGYAYLLELNKARDFALADLIRNAEKLGANAIIGVDFDMTEIESGYLLVSVNGTAVYIEAEVK